VKSGRIKEFFLYTCKEGRWNSVMLLLRAEEFLISKKVIGPIRLSLQRDPDGNLPIYLALQSKVCTMEIVIALLEAHAELNPTDFNRIEPLLQPSLDSPPILDFNAFKVLCGMLSNQSKLITLNVHLCGNGRAGKTSVKKCLDKCLSKHPTPFFNYFWRTRLGRTASTVGMEVSQVQFENMCWVLYDYGGQKIYHVNHSTHLAAPNSIYIIVLATFAFEDNTEKKTRECKPDEISQNYEYWLKFINSTASPASTIHCITVINFDSAFLQKMELSAVLKNLQEKFSKSESFEKDSTAASVHSIKFCGELLFVQCNQLGEVEWYLNPLLNDTVKSIAPNPLPSIRLVDLVKKSLRDNKSGVKAMPSSDFHDLIKKVIPKEYKYADAAVLHLLIDLVVKNMRVRGEILVGDVISEKEESHSTQWVVVDVNWLTRDVLGSIFKNLDDKSKVKNFRQLENSKLTSISLDELTKPKDSGITAKTYFGGDDRVLPKLLHCIGACIRLKDNSRTSNADQNWFPIFSRIPPAADQCQLMYPFCRSTPSRLIIRRFELKEANKFIFPSGYFSRLFVAVASLFNEDFKSVEVFEGAIDLQFAEVEERVQVIIRSKGDFFYLIVISVKDSNPITSTAWRYYLKIITLFNRTSNMLSKESAPFHWQHRHILVKEFCCDPESMRNLKAGETIPSLLPFQKIEEGIKGCWLELSEIELEIYQDVKIRNNRLVYLYGVNQNGTHVDEDEIGSYEKVRRGKHKQYLIYLGIFSDPFLLLVKL